MLGRKWQCDDCGQTIGRTDKGWLKWAKNHNDETLSNFRIVHHPICKQAGPKIQNSYRTSPGDYLSEFLGENGLIRLLELIPQTKLESQNKLLEIIQRLHIPNYERARPYFNEAFEDKKIVPPVNGVYYLTIEKLEEIYEEYEKHK